jgi:(p)ppGpp synthase/HD superfamily hydrolase
MDWDNIYRRCVHDVVEDTHYRKDIERLFNPKVAQLVEGLK